MEINALTDDRIVEGLLRRDGAITREFFYRKCFPLFNAIYSRFHTDCDSPLEFINEIYTLVMTPGSNGLSKLQTFGYRCSLLMWLKIVAENHCRALFAKKTEIIDRSTDIADRNIAESQSLESSFRNLDTSDVVRLLRQMPNIRYRKLIVLRYLEEKSNEETAKMLEMTMDNYYNKHRLAKNQFCEILKKEGLI